MNGTETDRDAGGLVMAVLNEIVWRNFSTDTWVNFKVFGIMPLTFAFSLALLPVMMRYQLANSDEPDKSG